MIRPFFRSYSSLVHRHIDPLNTPLFSSTSLSYTFPLSEFNSVQPCLLYTLLLQTPPMLQAKNLSTLWTIPLFHLFKTHMKSTHPKRTRLYMTPGHPMRLRLSLTPGSQKHLLQLRRPSLFLKPGCQEHLLQPNLKRTSTVANYV